MDTENHACLTFSEAGQVQLVIRLLFHVRITLAIENCSYYRLHQHGRQGLCCPGNRAVTVCNQTGYGLSLFVWRGKYVPGQGDVLRHSEVTDSRLYSQ